MEFKAFMVDMVRSELEDAVGREHVSISQADKLSHGVDYFWVSRMWVDKGRTPPVPDFVVRPGSAEEVSKILKIANYYKIPVQTWGGGSGSQGSALPMAGGIILDIKRMNRLLSIDEVRQRAGVFDHAPSKLPHLRHHRRRPGPPRHRDPIHQVWKD